MAVENIPGNSRVQIQFDLGLDGDGKKITRTKTLSNIQAAALDQDIYDVVNALVALQSNPVIVIRKVEQSDLVNA
ncbi:MAG: DUF1659 domain-containing protein [Firmicutes bacterium]|nr:DUF1659 domain-containing protein [Bacillota bacterium]